MDLCVICLFFREVYCKSEAFLATFAEFQEIAVKPIFIQNSLNTDRYLMKGLTSGKYYDNARVLGAS